MERDVFINKYESNTVRWSFKEIAFRFHVKNCFFYNNLKRDEHVNGRQLNMNAGSSEILVFFMEYKQFLYSYPWQERGNVTEPVHAQGLAHILFHRISHMIVDRISFSIGPNAF
jgi:hypothetical protein